MNWFLLLDTLHKVFSILVNLDKLNERRPQFSQWMRALNWFDLRCRVNQLMRGLVITHTLLMLLFLALAAATYYEQVYSPHMEVSDFLVQCRYIFGGVVIGLVTIYGCFTNNWKLANC